MIKPTYLQRESLLEFMRAESPYPVSIFQVQKLWKLNRLNTEGRLAYLKASRRIEFNDGGHAVVWFARNQYFKTTADITGDQVLIPLEELA